MRTRIAGRGSTTDLFSLHGNPQLVHQSKWQRFRAFKWSRLKEGADKLLTHPPLASTGFIRGLIHTAKRMEEAGEFFADMSSVLETGIRNAISDGNELNARTIFATGVARLLVTAINIPLTIPFLGTKTIGCAGYGTSLLLSILALLAESMHGCTCKFSNFSRIENTEITEVIEKKQSVFSKSSLLALERNTLKVKLAILDRLKNRLGPKLCGWAQQGINRLSDELDGTHLKSLKGVHAARRWHSGYMLANPQNYGTFCRTLIGISRFSYSVAAKLTTSFDKHAAFWLNRKLASQGLGDVIGIRLCLTATTLTYIFVALHWGTIAGKFGIGVIGALACAFSLSAWAWPHYWQNTASIMAIKVKELNTILIFKRKHATGLCSNSRSYQVRGKVTPC
ncbi:MAG: hypothetical protein HC848_02450 [Limnobacter sp.]|nr:hypothetical protein [Limnobacter sp.]